ncbi:MAG: hypothetical protein ACX93O_08690 [Flagellimonas sp.]|nr:hypothetical protein [Allomuricauda sp.]|tara:strand:- start:5033 stop:5161 length:129 start_codon:yes stop_codon:yes gene_type:complete
MQEKEKAYNGIWKQAGCILSLIAIFGIIALVIIGLYLLIQGY